MCADAVADLIDAVEVALKENIHPDTRGHFHEMLYALCGTHA